MSFTASSYDILSVKIYTPGTRSHTNHETIYPWSYVGMSYDLAVIPVHTPFKRRKQIQPFYAWNQEHCNEAEFSNQELLKDRRSYLRQILESFSLMVRVKEVIAHFIVNLHVREVQRVSVIASF